MGRFVSGADRSQTTLFPDCMRGGELSFGETCFPETLHISAQIPFLTALHTFGIERIMFSVDYPYSPNARGRAFLDRLSLAPADMIKLTHGNADALLKLEVKTG